MFLTQLAIGGDMQIRMTTRHYKAPNNIREYVEKKVQRLDKYFDGIIDCDVTLSYEKLDQVAEFALNVQGQKLVVVEKSDDIYKCIDFGVDKLERQLKKYKNKLKERKASKPSTIPLPNTQ